MPIFFFSGPISSYIYIVFFCFFRALPPNRNSIEYHGHPREIPEKHHNNIIEILEGCYSNPIKLPKNPHGNTI